MGLELHYLAFWDLCPDRNPGGRIQWTAKDRYCVSLDLDADQREDLFYYVDVLDAAYLEYHLGKQKKSKPIRKGGKFK